MKYEGFIIRPPSEAYSILLQVTVGCSHNKCTFCPTYKGGKFRIKSFDEIEEDILDARRFCGADKLFLCDGDALIIPQKRLVEILGSINKNIRNVKRVGTYGNVKSILRKTTAELKALKSLGLDIIYLGVETGNEELLQKINKGATYQQMVEAGRRVKEAEITLSVTVLLGIGGTAKSTEHARDTAKILSDIDPDYVGALTLMVVPGTALYEDFEKGIFILPNAFGYLNELGIMIANSDFTNCFFTSNHASNYLPIKARLPLDKDNTISLIQGVIEKGDPKLLRPEYMRGL
jgi:radical SAM superfamily enzyme YgiQ (UPF0313 family)